jgi:hypothetical protein
MTVSDGWTVIFCEHRAMGEEWCKERGINPLDAKKLLIVGTHSSWGSRTHGVHMIDPELIFLGRYWDTPHWQHIEDVFSPCFTFTRTRQWIDLESKARGAAASLEGWASWCLGCGNDEWTIHTDPEDIELAEEIAGVPNTAVAEYIAACPPHVILDLIRQARRFA